MRLGEDDAWAKRQKYSNSNIMKNENSADGLEVKRDTFPPPARISSAPAKPLSQLRIGERRIMEQRRREGGLSHGLGRKKNGGRSWGEDEEIFFR